MVLYSYINPKFHFLFLILFFFLCFPLFSFAINDDLQILQSFKNSVEDRDNVLASWNNGDSNHCSWYGITCDDHQHVISIEFPSSHISAPFPIHLCKLPNLLYMSLFNNSFHSVLPESISLCSNLEYLDLSQNFLTGPLPSAIGDFKYLRYLDLSGNNFSGEIPQSFSRLHSLEAFSLISNLVGGPIPAFFGNLSSLKMLNLSYNPFNPGKIPPEFGNLASLEVLWLTNCNLEGEIPDTLRGLKHLILLDLSMNRLSGSFPAALTELTTVTQIELFNNSLSGVLPDGFSKLKSLRMLDVSMNKLVGPIPGELFELPLVSINAFENQFEGSLPQCMGASTTLREVKLFGNRLTGELPRDLGKYSPLKSLDISHNFFTGRLPEALCAKGVLIEIMMLNNQVSGEIPESLGECHSLSRIRLSINNFSGYVPEKLWGLPGVMLMELSKNSFSGSISKNIVNSKQLSLLLISHNNFSGTIPDEIGSLHNMVEFSAGHNKFIGNFPESLTKLKRLAKLDLQSNMFSGLLGGSFEAWERLNELNLANNNLSGEIPQKIAFLPVLNYLDLSGNQFSGKIPNGLQNLNLNVLNLSHNHLTGTLPSYFETSGYKNSFLGNPDLCREGNGACNKPVQSIQKEANDSCDEGGSCIWMLWGVLTLIGALLIAGVVMFHIQFRRYLRENSLNLRTKWTVISFHKVCFDENEIVNSLDEDNVIGSGGTGQVYKVALENGKIIAVKKLWTEPPNDSKSNDLETNWTGDDAFDAEVKTVGRVRHNNIVKLWCCCTNAHCKLLVYEYMPNGSLGDMLHGSKSEFLDWSIRYKIALDVAAGLSYLHHDCVPPIVHRDVKSDNILLGADFGARIADFGLATVVDIYEDQSNPVVAGSCGYIAPEYGYSLKVSTKSDVFSFGMIILELVTGKRPTDPEFVEKDLVQWVRATIEQKDINHVLDPKLDSCHHDEMLKVLNIGLLCSCPLPVNRPSMRQVLVFLEEVRMNNESITKRVGRMSPYYFEDASDSGK